eukprot:gene44669-60490_t
MSDFPKGGDVKVTRAWLDQEGFFDVFKGNIWKADALLGKDDEFIKSKFPSTEEGQERAEVLCGLLNTAKRLKEGVVDESLHGIRANAALLLTIGQWKIEQIG